MKKMLIGILVVVLVLALLLLGALIVQGVQSRKMDAPGLVDGKLAHCPASPNCFNSEYPDDASHFTAPIPVPTAHLDGINTTIVVVIETMGGDIQFNDGDYVASTFQSKLFGFVDDLEVRVDRNASLLQLRSGSRVGYGDMGVNQARVEQFKTLFNEKVAEKSR